MESVRRDRLLAAVLGIAAGPAAYLLAAALPPQPVLIGTAPSGLLVPPPYQASVAPAFVAFCAALGLDLAAGRSRSTWGGRAALVAVTGGLSLLRLAQLLPLSGHGLFLSAALAHDLRARAPAERAALAAAGLAVVLAYKLAWGDLGYFALSAALGAAVGLACARQPG